MPPRDNLGWSGHRGRSAAGQLVRRYFFGLRCSGVRHSSPDLPLFRATLKSSLLSIFVPSFGGVSNGRGRGFADFAKSALLRFAGVGAQRSMWVSLDQGLNGRFYLSGSEPWQT